MKLLLSLSALPPSLYRQYVKGWNKEKYADLFRKYTGDRNNYRIHIPLVKGAKRIAYAPVPEAIQLSVAEKGYTVEDYITGIAVDRTGKRRIKIGKLLPPELQKVFAEDKARSNARNAASGTQMVVISRHPYDVAGMSTDRGWVSCMNLIAGSNAKYVIDDVRQGSIIAYLVNKDDVNLRRPSARILMRVYRAENGKRGLYPSGIYGARSQLFFDTVRKWCSEVNNTYFGIPYGMSMSLLEDLYNDGRAEVVNDDYDPANALKELETALRERPSTAVAELNQFSSRFGSDVSEFFNLANSIKSETLDAVLGERALAKIRLLVEDNEITSDYKGAAELAMRAYRTNPKYYSKNDPIALIQTSKLTGNNLLSASDGIKIAATLSRAEDMSMSRVYSILMDSQASRPLLDAASKFGLSSEQAISIMTSDTHNNWHRVELSKDEVKMLKKSLAADGVDELPIYYEAALAPASKMPAMFKAYCEKQTSEVLAGRTTGRFHSPYAAKLFVERMPVDKWPTAFRGLHLLPLLLGSTFARDTNKQALAAMEPFLAKRVVDYFKSDTKNGCRMLRILRPLVNALNGRQFGKEFFTSIPDELWLEPAASVLGLDALMTGTGGRAQYESDIGLTQWISDSPIRVMTLSNTEDFNSGAFQSVMSAIESDPKSCAKIIANIKTAIKMMPNWSYQGAQALPIVCAATTVADYAVEAEANGVDVADELRSNFGSRFSTAAIRTLLASGLGTL